MDFFVKSLVKQNHPEYTEDEVREEVFRLCEENFEKAERFLNQYLFSPESESFEPLRWQVMTVLMDSPRKEIVNMLCRTTNYEQGMLMLLGDKYERGRVEWCLSNRLKVLIIGEAYFIGTKLSPGEKEFEEVLKKVLDILIAVKKEG